MTCTQYMFTISIILLCVASCKIETDSKNAMRQIEVVEQNGSDTIKNISRYSNAPNNITRSIIGDQYGSIWLATFGGMIKYERDSFNYMTTEITSFRFFSVMEDRQGGLWFGTLGEGVYHYDGSSFQNFTTKEGLINNAIVSIYQDKKGDIWFGANKGISRYDGVSFDNYLLNENSITKVSAFDINPSSREPFLEVNSILEDNYGNMWFATRGRTFVYDGNTFEPIANENIYFRNVRWMIEDRRNNIWLGGNDGLWRYDGKAYEKVTDDFVGYIYEDSAGNIWTSSDGDYGWSLSRYDPNSLSNVIGAVEIIKTGEKMLFGILEDNEKNIWVGSLNGVFRYNGESFEDFKR